MIFITTSAFTVIMDNTCVPEGCGDRESDGLNQPGVRTEHADGCGVRVPVGSVPDRLDVQMDVDSISLIAAIKQKSKGLFDDNDATKVAHARKAVVSKKISPRHRSPRFSTPKRRALVAKYKYLMGHRTPLKFKGYSRREKCMVVSAKKFCKAELRRYREVTAREDSYVREQIDEVPVIPFSQVNRRVQKMLGRARVSIIGMKFFI